MGVARTPGPVIQVSRICKSYGALAAVSFEVSEGEVFGLIGPNGAGKTTTMECVEGVRQPDAGQISILGLDPFRDIYLVQNRIGVQLQQAQLQKRIKVWEAVDLWASLYSKPLDGNRLLEQLGLADKRNAWFMNLSGGQKQRLFIALALINDPQVVFLDELTTGLDPQSRRAIWDLVRGIRDRGKTVLLTTHLMEEAERLCDRVAIIEYGKIIDIGSPGELVARHCPMRTVVLATGNALAEETHIQIWVGCKPEAVARIRVQYCRRTGGVAIGVHADRVVGRVRDTKLEILQQAGLLQIHSVFEIVMAFGGGDVGLHAPVQKLALLALGGGQIVSGR